jgi:16S rRNA (guanine966-N2)-methyltransferase
MRVIAGELGGRHLRAPEGRGTRPTADRVREAIFSILGDVTGLRVLDLFAGSGALGIEALSRGADEAVFVDNDPRAITAVRRNLAALDLLGAQVSRGDALAFLADAAPDAPPFDLVFVDPPYSSANRLAPQLAKRLTPVLAEDAVIVTESYKREPLELPFTLVRERTYGDTRVAVHRHG